MPPPASDPPQDELIEKLHIDLSSTVGMLAIEFARCELAVAEVASAALGAFGSDERDSLNAVISFRQKLDLIAALGFKRMPTEDAAEMLTSCLSKLDHFEQQRNTFLHSKYNLRLGPGDEVQLEGYWRSKPRADRKRGLVCIWDDIDPINLIQLSREIRHFVRQHPDDGPLYQIYRFLAASHNRADM